jgi:hypothetical protein
MDGRGDGGRSESQKADVVEDTVKVRREVVANTVANGITQYGE